MPLAPAACSMSAKVILHLAHLVPMMPMLPYESSSLACPRLILVQVISSPHLGRRNRWAPKAAHSCEGALALSKRAAPKMRTRALALDRNPFIS